MTTINFPSSPAVDQAYALGDKSWAWNGTVSNGLDTARGWGTGSPKTIRLNGGGTEYSTDSGATKTSSGFTLAGLSDGSHLYMAIRKSI